MTQRPPTLDWNQKSSASYAFLIVTAKNTTRSLAWRRAEPVRLYESRLFSFSPLIEGHVVPEIGTGAQFSEARARLARLTGSVMIDQSYVTHMTRRSSSNAFLGQHLCSFRVV
ncbi:protein of unknown function [Candidatus Nitrospira inopinata]|uniref:Uncharacterized protein n=1 Tax=Candidatus Nitrospira inopinata TaxID=1715989 RepID=A0A0S4KRZ5_9BACT|nr:protein of unknown function [Candidatus Nitrospira inopinata]